MRRALVLAVLAGGLLVGGAAPAAADLNPLPDCKTAPVPSRPDLGVTAWFDGGNPAVPASDPFDDASVTLFDAYGFSGLTHHTYDLGCKPNGGMLSAPAMTSLGNLALVLVAGALGLTFALLRTVLDPTWLALFDPAVQGIVAALGTAAGNLSLSAMLLLLGALFTAAVVVTRKGAGDYAESARSVGKVLGIVLFVGSVVAAPLLVAAATDRALVAIVSTSHGAVAGVTGGVQRNPADLTAGLVTDKITYPLWLRGVVGSSDSAVARKYGPDLWRATHLTWAESRTASSSADAANDLYDDKADLWADTADKIKEEDRAAYEVLKGTSESDRLGAVLLLSAAVACLLPLVAISALLLLAAYIAIRVGTMAAPVVAPLALFGKSGEKAVLSALAYVTAALRNAVVFGAALALYVPVSAAVLTAPGVPLWLALGILAAVTVAFFKVTKPFRSLGIALVPQAAKRAAGYVADKYVNKRITESAVEDALEDDREAQAEKTAAPAAAEAAAAVPGRVVEGEIIERPALAAGAAAEAAPAQALPAGTWTWPTPDRTETGAVVVPPATRVPTPQPALPVAESLASQREAEAAYLDERRSAATGSSDDLGAEVGTPATPTAAAEQPRVDWTAWPVDVFHPDQQPPAVEPFAVDPEVDPVTGEVVHSVTYMGEDHLR